ncbi:hypothetical protein [Hydrocarboniphaga sp.]|uniref:hypothetical protein n=1 Tax=Hydrocarboniphaga sp. TaxID=2033016 RepID=UPI003D137D59
MKRAFLLLVVSLSGCATTTITGFTDPDYRSKSYKNFVVVTPNLNLEYSSLLQGKVCSAIQAKNASCVRGLDLFPPTRTFDNASIIQKLTENKIDGYLLLTYGGGSTQSQQVGTLAYGSATVFANTISAYGSSTPVMSFSRSDGYGVVLIDTQSYNKAWVGGTRTQAQGLANITDDVFTGSLADQIAYELQRAGHL